MGRKKLTRKKAAVARNNLVEVPHLRSYAVITIIYAVAVALLALLVGWTIAAIIATPIWAFLSYVFLEWNRGGEKHKVADWRALLRFPKLNYWNLFAVILTIGTVQVVVGLLFGFIDERVRPEIDYSGLDIPQVVEAFVNDTTFIIASLVGAVISYFAGGFMAGKLRNKKCPAPYRHALSATVIWNLLNVGLTVSVLALSGDEDFLSSEDLGYIILATSPSYLLAAFGVWLGIRKRETAASAESLIALSDKPAIALAGLNSREMVGRLSKKKHGRRQLPAKSTSIEEESTVVPEPPPRKTLAKAVEWLRSRRVTISISFVVTCLLVLGVWAFIRKYPKPVYCENAPATATLNFWPVAFTPGVACHEYPPVDARLTSADHYSGSHEEWERGLAAKKGDEIYVLVYINNGAMSNAEQISPGRGIARNVRLRTAIAQDFSEIHFVEVEFAGDNTNTVVSRFRIATAGNERLEVLPQSGEISKYISREVISKDLDVGNNTIFIGDLPPKQDAAVYIRFRVRVVG